MVAKILYAAAKNGIHLYLNEGRLAYKARAEALTDELKKLIAEHKTEIIEFLAGSSGSNSLRFPQIQKVSEELIGSPLSFAQQRLWLLDQIDGGSSHYNMPYSLRLTGTLDYAALNQAFRSIIERHESLRTRFILGEDGQPLQVVQAATAFVVPVTDLSLLKPDWRQLKLTQVITEEANRLFDLSHDLMLRAQLFKVAENEHIVLVTMHHIASDGWSMSILINEFRALYSAYVQGQTNPLSPLVIQYADYAHWQRTWLQDDVLNHQLDYWAKQLADLPLVHGLPLDHVRPTLQSFVGKIYRSHIAPTVRTQLHRLCQESGATLFMGLHAAFSVLLSRYSNETDIVVGSPVANREQNEIAGLIGFFVNTLVLRSNLSGDPSFTNLLAQSKAALLDAYAHQQVPFEQLVERLQPERSLNHSALFQIMLVLQNNEAGALELPGLTLTPVEQGSAVAKYDLTLTINEHGQDLTLDWEYNTDLFEPDTIARMASHFDLLLTGLVNQPQVSVFSVNLLSEQERQQRLVEWNPLAPEYPNDKCIHELFEAQAERYPNAIAVTYEGQQLTYGELNRQANQLAHFLVKEKQVKPDTLVGICVERSLAMVTGILAILKAGGAYVPLDPEYPEARLTYLLGDAKLNTVLTQTHLRSLIPVSDAQALCIDDAGVQQQLALQPSHNITPQQLGLTSSHLAYVIYTSGSTGNPKGVMVEHYNITRLMAATQRDFEFTRDDVWTMFHSYAFDFSVWEIWGALTQGGRLLVVPYWVSRSPGDFYQLLVQEKVTVLNQTPSAFTALMHEDERKQLPLALRYVIFGGEALNFAALQPWCTRHGDQQPQLINMYGITETTVHVTYRRLTTAELATATGASFIGAPLADLQVLILNTHNALVPVGVAGEMYVGGAGVTRGYLQQAELTASRFVSLPEFGTQRFYRSGDLARHRANGELDYLGRIDHQVKIRGFRIELGEIENALTIHQQVKDAVVLAKTSMGSDDKRLVAYVVTDSVNVQADTECAAFIEVLRQHLGARLPDYMVPSSFVLLDQFPLTTNGKVDTKALPEPDMTTQQLAYVAPRSETERLLCEIWQEVLGVEHVGITDNFFQLGGHSLLIMQVISRLQQQGFSITARQLFTAPTLMDLAAVLNETVISAVPAFKAPANLIPENCTDITPSMLPLVTLTSGEIANIVAQIPGGASNVQDIYPLSPLQEGILFHHMMNVQSDPYVLPSLFKMQSAKAVADFIDGVQFVMRRHDVLRTAILWRDLSVPVQVVCRHVSLPVTWLTLDAGQTSSTSHGVGQDIAAQMYARCAPDQQWMELGQAPLLRLQIAVDKSSQEHFVLLQYHHIISDHVGLEIIQRELALYQAGQADLLPAPVPYREFVAQAQYQAQHNDAETFFKNMLGDVEEPTALFNVLDVTGDGSGIVELKVDVPADIAHQIRQLTKSMMISPAALFHTAWAMVVSACSGRDDVVFGTVLSGRLQGTLGAENMLGVFINTLPVRVKLGDTKVIEVVRQVQQSLLDLLPYEQAPLTVAQRASGLSGAAPLFTAILNYRHSTLNDAVTNNLAGLESGFELLAGQERTNYPFTLSVDDLGHDFVLDLQVDSAVDAERILAYVQTAIAAITNALLADVPPVISSLTVLPVTECDQLLVDWNDSGTQYPNQCIHELFEAQVELNPNAVALVFGAQQLTYCELNTRANQLANYLINEKQLQPDTLVGIYVERSLEMVIGILGILKAGGAYVPLDPDYPAARLAYMLSDAALEVVITLRHLCDTTSIIADQAVCLDDSDLQQQLILQSTINPQARQHGLTSNHLAYVIYTSGSTGNPKGVMVEHTNVVRLVKSTNYISFSSSSVIAQASNMSFDAMTFELWGALLNGGKIVYIAKDTLLDAINLQQVILQQQINTLFITTALFNTIAIDCPTALASVDYVLFGGEDCSLPLVQRLVTQGNPQNLLHVYGPTENTTFSLWKKLVPDYLAQTTKVALGKALSNTTAYVLNSSNQLTPISAIGELHLGGAGVARGYLNRPDLTAEKFIANPFFDPADPTSSERLYKTGDLVRWLPDGDLEFVGRIDHQVKIRGFRIELGEIEQALVIHADVKDAVVLARDSTTGKGDKRLVAYVVADTKNAYESVQIAEDNSIGLQHPLMDNLRAHLSQQLPDYMVPSAFVLLDALPLTPNGKVDRKALPEPDMLALQATYVAPANEIEAALCELWQEVLGIERVGVTDNFFQLGGHSLSATRLVTRINQSFHVTVPLAALFHCEDLRAVGDVIAEHIVLYKNKKLEINAEEKSEVEW